VLSPDVYEHYHPGIFLLACTLLPGAFSAKELIFFSENLPLSMLKSADNSTVWQDLI